MVLLSIFLFILCCEMFLLCLSSLFTFCMIHHIKIYFILTCFSILLPCMHVWKSILPLSFPRFVFLHTSPIIPKATFVFACFLLQTTATVKKDVTQLLRVQDQIKKKHLKTSTIKLKVILSECKLKMTELLSS